MAATSSTADAVIAPEVVEVDNTPTTNALAPIVVNEAAVVTSASKVVAYLQKNRGRSLVAALVFKGPNMGYVGGALEQMAIVVGDSTTFTTADDGEWRIGEPELVGLIDMAKLTPTMFKLSGLEDALKSDGILKIVHDSRLAGIAMEEKFKMRPTPVFDTAIADILFRQEDKEKRLARMHNNFHYQVFQSPALRNALGNLCRISTYGEAIIEHKIASGDDLKGFSVVQEAVALYRMFKRFEMRHRNSKALAWSELVHWSDRLVGFYTSPKAHLPVGPDGKTIKLARTGEGLTQVVYDNNSILPLAVMPRRSAIGDGSQIQVGRLFTVDQHTRVCKGCNRKIGPCNDCFEPRAEYCYLCNVLNWSFRFRTEGKDKPTIAAVVAAVNAAQDLRLAAEAEREAREAEERAKAAEIAVEVRQGQPRRKKIYKEKRRK